jgi:hypothetical protein
MINLAVFFSRSWNEFHNVVVNVVVVVGNAAVGHFLFLFRSKKRKEENRQQNFSCCD